LNVAHLTQKWLKFGEFIETSANGANVDMQRFVPILVQRNRTYAPGCIIDHFWRSNMLALIARWAHNILLASMALLTIALVVSAT
jgi:hypothetical protein